MDDSTTTKEPLDIIAEVVGFFLANPHEADCALPSVDAPHLIAKQICDALVVSGFMLMEINDA